MTAALLLAAGASRRMGSPKPLLDWHGRPLVQYQINELRAAGCDDVVVVLGDRAARVSCFIDDDPHTIVVENPDHRLGRASSVRAGASALPSATQWVAVLGVDQPRPAMITRFLLTAAMSSRAAIIVPTHNGRRGHPTLFASQLLPEMLGVQEETLGLRAILQRHRDDVQEIEISGKEAETILLDLNTPQDYEKARKTWG